MSLMTRNRKTGVSPMLLLKGKLNLTLHTVLTTIPKGNVTSDTQVGIVTFIDSLGLFPPSKKEVQSAESESSKRGWETSIKGDTER